MATGIGTGPNPNPQQISARKAFYAARKQNRMDWTAARNKVISDSKAVGGAAGAQQRRAGLQQLQQDNRAKKAAYTNTFTSAIKANRGPGQGANSAKTPGSFTFMGGTPKTPLTEPQRNNKNKFSQLVRKASGAGKNALAPAG